MSLAVAPGLEATPSRRASAVRALLGSAEGRVGLALAIALTVLAVGGQIFAAPTAPADYQAALPPSSEHVLGTDALGRDVWDRLAAGGSTVVIIPLLASTLAAVIGGGSGLVAGALGGWTDSIVSKSYDLLLTLPPILVILFVISIFGSADAVLVVTVALVFAPQFGRVVRGATQTVSASLYVDAARARGESRAAIVLREVLPNTLAPAIAVYALTFTYSILFVASLSFLGLGVQPPRPDWGLMVAENRAILMVQPLASLAPALAITLLAISVNLIADVLAKHLTHVSRERLVDL